MVYNLTSVKKVIAKVFRDLELNEGDHRVNDMIEFAGEAMEKIGAFPSFITKVTGKDDVPILEVSNYQARLPFDFYRLIQIAYGSSSTGPFYPMRYATGSFDYGNTINESTDADSTVPTADIITLAMDLYDLTYEQAVEKINTESSTRSKLSYLLSQDTVSGPAGEANETTDYTYTVTNSFIKTNVSSGYLMVAYQAIPTDGDGYPMIPDVPSFHEAIYWYINMKVRYPQWVQGQVRDAVYYDTRRSWNYYCKQAYGEAMMPNQDQMESIKNAWLKLVPEINQHDSFFNTLGQEEKVYNHHR
ncbi:MAG TPA: hypothetical protein VJ907_04305 [Halanaerobiales bacterium]|nr:hypothetical protein [Halanaerobiales bacterium]